MSTVARRSAHGILALVSRTFLLNVVSFASSLIIFSVLTASDVGIYTAVVAIQRIISFFTDIGFGAALVQKREELKEEDLTTSFTVQLFLTLSVFATVLVLSSSILSFFHLNAVAGRLLIVLVLSIVLSSFKTIPSILLERKIEFQKLVIPQMTESIVFNVILIVMVLKGFGIDSFSVAFLVSSVISIPIYFYISPWKVRLGLNKSSLTHLKFGFAYQMKNVLATVKDDLLTVLLTKFLSFAEIGYIGFAQRLSFFVFRYIVDSVTKVTFSTYSRVQDRLDILKKGIEKSLFFVSCTMFPILFGLIVTGGYIIEYFPKWHGKWEPAIISLIFFSLNAMVSSVSGILVNVLDASGRVKTTLKLMVMWTILTWVLTLIFIKLWGYNGVAIASFLVTLTIVITVQLARRVVDFAFFRNIYKPLISSVIMGIVIYFCAPYFISSLFSLIVVSAVGGSLYIILLYLLAKKELHENINLFFRL